MEDACTDIVAVGRRYIKTQFMKMVQVFINRILQKQELGGGITFR